MPRAVADILAELGEALHVEYGHAWVEVRVRAKGGRRFRAPIPDRPPAHAAEVPFVLTPFQQAILDALEGKALRTDALGAAVGDRSRLFKPHGLKELRERGLVDHHDRLGYCRPDAPPPELDEA